MNKYFLFLFYTLVRPTHSVQNSLVVNQRPIIGILAQEIYREDGQAPNNSYIAASYVKFLEGAGAQVVPILINQNSSYIQNIFGKINGILFPGGSVYFPTSNGFVETGRELLRLAKEANEAGDFFPVWGTCLGFEFMTFEALGGKDVRTSCGAWNVVDTLKFTKDAMKSRLFGSAPKQVVKSLATEKLTANFHHLCISQQNFTTFGLDSQYMALSLNYDKVYGVSYVSSIEHRKYPFYGVQFHPEKNIYEWNLKENIPHSSNAVAAGQFFANYFIAQARSSSHKFKNEAEENQHLIYNYSPSFTGLNGDTFEQKYYFPL